MPSEYINDVIKPTVVILSSQYLNNAKILKEYSQEIEQFMKENIPENSLITIGSIKNGELIMYLQDNGYEITKKKQAVPGLERANEKLVEDNDIVLFFNYNNSKHMEDFINYANSLDSKEVKVLKFEME